MCWENPEPFMKRQAEPFLFTAGHLSSAQLCIQKERKGRVSSSSPFPCPLGHLPRSTNGAEVHAGPGSEAKPAFIKKSAAMCSAGEGEKSNSLESWWAAPLSTAGRRDPTERRRPAHRRRAGLSQRVDPHPLLVHASPKTSVPAGRP